MLKSKPMIFQDPLLLRMMFSGHKLPWTIFTPLCRKDKPSEIWMENKIKKRAGRGWDTPITRNHHTVWKQWACVFFYLFKTDLHKSLKQNRGILTCNKPYLVSTSYSLYSLMSEGTGLGRLSHWPSTLDRLANTGSVQNAKQSLGKEVTSLSTEMKSLSQRWVVLELTEAIINPIKERKADESVSLFLAAGGQSLGDGREWEEQSKCETAGGLLSCKGAINNLETHLENL